MIMYGNYYFEMAMASTFVLTYSIENVKCQGIGNTKNRRSSRNLTHIHRLFVMHVQVNN